LRLFDRGYAARRSPAVGPDNRAVRAIVAAAAIIILGIIVGAAAVLWDSRQAAWREAVHNSENLAAAFEHDIKRNIEIYDLTLRSTIEDLQLPNIWTVDPLTRQHILFDGVVSARYLGAVVVLDEHGNVLAQSNSPTPQSGNVSDREYFTAHRDNPHLGLFISHPFRGRGSHQWSIGISRRLDHPDGSFAGVVVGSLRLGFFRHLFERIDFGPGGGATLAHTDRILIARTPYREADIGHDISSWSVFRDPNPPPIVVTRARSMFDGTDRLYVSQKVGDLPLRITVFVPTDRVFAEWRQKALIVGIAVVGLTGVAGILGVLVFVELRRRSRAERVMAESEHRYRLLAENSTDLIVRLSLDGVRRYVSPACRELYGIEPEQLLGTKVANSTHPDERDAVLTAFEAMRDGAERVVVTSRKRRVDGSYIWIESTMRRVAGRDGEEAEIVAVARDVTARKEAEEALREAKDAAERANQTKARFLADMSHELRTPLNAVIGFSDLMEHEVFGPLGNRRYREYAADIRSSGQHVLEMINDILDHAKATAGHLELLEGTVPIAELIDFALHLLSPRAERAGVALVTQVAPEVYAVHGDKRRLRQILLNLATNAIKFTPGGGRVRISAALGAGGELLLTVEDTGAGIAEEDQAAILEPFRQVRRGASDQEGTGLGLPLTRRLVELHGGTMQLRSTLGVGTIVVVRLPRERVIAHPDAQPTQSPAAILAA
jgi:PAS domain S-box-containing protein